MPKKRVSSKQRQIVAERAYGCCEYCQSQVRFATKSFSIEHIHPRNLSGATALSNLAFACPGCNGHKHTKIKAVDPVTLKLMRLYHPREQKWTDHFGWSEDFTQIVGLTPIGRATVQALKLNRNGVVNLRRVCFRRAPTKIGTKKNGSRKSLKLFILHEKNQMYQLGNGQSLLTVPRFLLL